MTSKVDAKEAGPNPEVVQDPEPSYEACDKVLETVELLEMILLSLHGSQDIFCGTRGQHHDTVHLPFWPWDDDAEFSVSNSGLTYAYNQEEASCNMKTLLFAQRVNRMFNQTIQGSVKLQRALWFTKLEGSRGESASQYLDRFPRINPLFSKPFDTPAHIDGFWFLIPFTPRPTLHVKFNRKVQITPTRQPESWSRMLIAQSAEPTVMPMMVYVPKSLYSYAIPGPVHRVFEVHEPAGDVLRHAEETEHRAHLDLLRADLDDEELRQEVKELESKGGWLYDVAKANLRAVERELDEWFQ